ncbi:MAG: hypothetical protein U9R39_05515 [Campylobacterota bacterium]|nr:hypothetical protein [Campylobacterota bacterium]
MINTILNKLQQLTKKLKDDIDLDISDVRSANHESLLERNSQKLDSMEMLSSYKKQLNEELAKEFHAGVDISIYKDSIDDLEAKLKELYYLNGKLASIVLPVRQMYKDIIDDITRINGGSLIEVMA